MRAGLSHAQAEIYLALPGWMDAAFRAGVLLGLVGSALLLARRRAAVPALGVSLAAYAVLFAGDVAFAIFAAMGGQFVILVFVVLVAAGLVAVARRARSAGLLR